MPAKTLHLPPAPLRPAVTAAAPDTASAWLGVDVAKETLQVALYLPLPPGASPRPLATLPQASFAASREGVQRLQTWVEARLAETAEPPAPPSPVRLLMEATGRYSLAVCSYVCDVAPAWAPVIEDPRAVHDYARSLRLRNKTDTLDAAVLARYGYERQPVATTELPLAYRQLRELNRTRDHLVHQREETRKRLAECAAGSAAVVPRVVLQAQRKVLAEYNRQVAKLETAIGAHVEAEPQLAEAVRLITTIPGVGLLTAVTVLAECGPLERFTCSRQLGAYSGLTPERRQSGTSLNLPGRISRRGPGRVRQALYVSSLQAARATLPLGQFRLRLLAKGKTPMQARCAAMRKLLLLMRALVISGQPYHAGNLSALPETQP